MTPFEFLLGSFAVAAALIAMSMGLFRSSTRSGRIVSVVVAFFVLLSISGIAGQRLVIGELAAISAATLGVVLAAGVVRGTRAIATRPKVAATVCTAAGLTVAAIGSVVHERWNDANDANDAKQFERVMELIATVPDFDHPEISWVTDDGTAIDVRVAARPREKDQIRADELLCLASFEWKNSLIQRHPADDRTNCHGWVFTGGRGWVLGEDVPKILRDNDYLRIETPQPGDLAIYRSDDGTYKHTALVRSIGAVTMVESKWGWMGVYLHETDRSCYGTNIEYYRSPRSDHVVIHGSPSELPNLIGGAE